MVEHVLPCLFYGERHLKRIQCVLGKIMAMLSVVYNCITMWKAMEAGVHLLVRDTLTQHHALQILASCPATPPTRGEGASLSLRIGAHEGAGNKTMQIPYPILLTCTAPHMREIHSNIYIHVPLQE